MDSFSAGCACGQVKITVSAEPSMVANCHCRDCQHASGGAYSTIVMLPRDAVAIVGGVTQYTVTAESGNEVTRSFCPTCGSPLYSELSAMESLIVLKAASLDDPSWLRPTMHIWRESGQPWAEVDAELPSFEKNPG